MWLQQNPRFTRLVVALALALVTAASHPVLTQDQTALRGVVVEKVGSGSAGEKAGIRAGDVVLSWVRAAAPPANPDEAPGEIGSPFDLADVEIEQAPRGEVRILGTRDGRNFSVVIPPGAWDISARPVFAAPTLRAYQQARERIAAKQIDAGIDAWRALASQANIATNPELAAWLWLRIGDTIRNARRWDDAHVGYRAALEVARGDSNIVARVWEAEGMAFERQNDEEAPPIHRT